MIAEGSRRYPNAAHNMMSNITVKRVTDWNPLQKAPRKPGVNKEMEYFVIMVYFDLIKLYSFN